MSRVALVGGGRSGEHDVSLASAGAVAGVLAGRHDVVRLTIDREGTWRDHTGRALALAGAVGVATAPGRLLTRADLLELLVTDALAGWGPR